MPGTVRRRLWLAQSSGPYGDFLARLYARTDASKNESVESAITPRKSQCNVLGSGTDRITPTNAAVNAKKTSKMLMDLDIPKQAIVTKKKADRRRPVPKEPKR